MNTKYYIKCRVNGRFFEGYVDADLRLIDFLRDVLGLKGTKEGCGQGECGSCIVSVNGKVINSCLMLAFQCDGKEIITVEGADLIKESYVIKKKLREEGAVQCGFCIPAIVITASELVRKRKRLSYSEIKRYMSGNICRCSGYETIVRAIKGACDEICGKGKKLKRSVE